MGDWLGTGRVADQFKVFRPFKKARKFVHKLNLKNIDLEIFIIIDGSNGSPDSKERGIWISQQSFGWFENLQVSNNSWCGLCVWEDSHIYSSQGNNDVCVE